MEYRSSQNFGNLINQKKYDVRKILNQDTMHLDYLFKNYNRGGNTAFNQTLNCGFYIQFFIKSQVLSTDVVLDGTKELKFFRIIGNTSRTNDCAWKFAKTHQWIANKKIEI